MNARRTRKYGWRRVLAGSVAVALTLLSPTAAQADHWIESTFGGADPGATGGLFSSPQDIAVRESTGQVYVADQENNRVQRFSSTGAFEMAWGRDVVQTGGSGDDNLAPIGELEVCTVASECKAGDASAPDNAKIGGELAAPSGIAIRQSTGQVYVTESLGGRVSVFGPNGEWQRTFGWDTIQAGKPGNVAGSNEQQRVTVIAESGTFRLENPVLGSTDPIPRNATAAALEAALLGLDSLGPGDVSVSGAAGGPWTIDFAGAYVGTDVPQLGVNVQELAPPDQAGKSFSETLVNGAAYEICTVAADCRRGTDGTAAGQLGHATTGTSTGRLGIAIDQSSGDVFVGDARNNRINHYEADGDFVRSFGWGVDTGSAQFEVCTAASKCQRYLAEENFFSAPQNGEFKFGRLADLAIDSAGDVLYAGSQGRSEKGAHVFRFDTTQASAAGLLLPLTIYADGAFFGGKWPTGGTVDQGNLGGIEVDPANGHLLLSIDPVLPDQSVQELDPSTAPAALVERHAPQGDGILVPQRGLGFDGTRDRLFTSTQTGALGHRVLIFSQTPAPAMAVDLGDPADVEAHSATFSGTVTPNGPAGIESTYRFEYRKEGELEWLRAPAVDVNVGSGSAPVAVSQPVADLESGATYRVRLVGIKPFGEKILSAEKTFTTILIGPAVETLYPQARSDTGARLTGLINPNGAEVEYRFEWGETTSYGNQAPVPDGVLSGGKELFVTEELGGLKPGTTYHYRLVAEPSAGGPAVEGDDVSFETRPAFPDDPKRSFEMVTPPFKLTRATVDVGGTPGKNANPSFPSSDGEAVLWGLDYFPLLEESGMPFNGDKLISRRTATGWKTDTLQTLSVLPQYPAGLRDASFFATSGDFGVQAWTVGSAAKPAALLPNEGSGPLFQYTRKDGTGVKGFSGWLDNVDTQQVSERDEALLNDDGSAMARWGGYRGLGDDPETLLDEDLSDDLQLPGEEGGRTAYLQLGPPSGVKDLIGECSGSGAAATTVPERDGNGTADPADDFVDLQSCPAGNLASRRGAIVGSPREGGGALEGNAVTALADDGRRVFFTSPDPSATGVPTGSCDGALAADTSCPPQLFVRQYDGSGNPTVRWVSRSRSVAGPDGSYSGAPLSGQAVALLGPAVFEGASRDGRYVYFRSPSPLTPDDPNGQPLTPVDPRPVLTGAAAGASWDLYRYELPAGPGEDPDAGSLTRVSGGPTGDADPSAGSGGQGGTVARYISDDGRRAYFVTGAPIAGADETAPKGGATTPGESAATRSLYLYDTTGGAPQWRFVAQIPFAADTTGPDGFNACASFEGTVGASSDLSNSQGTGSLHIPAEYSCVRGTPNGSGLAFITQGQLTVDDTDSAADVYLYDARSDELVRVSAPPAGVASYACSQSPDATPAVLCNGEFGYAGNGVERYDTQRGWAGGRQFNVAMEPGGAISVIFESRSQLTAEDHNADIRDVYRWREGELRLLSLGRPGEHSYYSGSAVDGEDIFIWTNSRIDPREIDDSDYDTYDLRIGPGFPPPPASDPCDVLGFECEKEARTPAETTPLVSPGFTGPGNVGKRKSRCGKRKVRRRGRCVARHGSRKGRRGAGTKRGRR